MSFYLKRLNTYGMVCLFMLLTGQVTIYRRQMKSVKNLIRKVDLIIPVKDTTLNALYQQPMMFSGAYLSPEAIVYANGSEREQAKSFIPFIPSGGVILFDRGYPGYEFIKELIKSYTGYFVFRCPGTSTFPAVISFLASNKDEDIIWINPTHSYRVHLGVKMWRQAKPIKLRVIKLMSPDGTVSVLLTNLMNSEAFSRDDITKLYFRRWEVETHYRNEKIVLDIEKFHGKSPNSIRQELFAIIIVSVISRILMEFAEQSHQYKKGFPQFKNAVMTIAYDAAALTPDDPVLAVNIFKELLDEIARVRYYPSPNKRPSQPRFTKTKINRWSVARQRKMLCH